MTFDNNCGCVSLKAHNVIDHDLLGTNVKNAAVYLKANFISGTRIRVLSGVTRFKQVSRVRLLTLWCEGAWPPGRAGLGFLELCSVSQRDPAAEGGLDLTVA